MAILTENWDEGIRGNFSFQGSKWEEAKDELRHPEYLERYIRGNLTPSPKAGRDMFNCPFCGSGTHENKTGAFHAMPPKWGERARWKCEACGKSGDLFDLIGHFEHMEGKENFARQVKRAAEIFGLDIEPRGEKSTANTGPALFSFKANKADEPSTAEEPQAAETAEPLRTFEGFYREAHRHIGDTDYWQRRGLTAETVQRFNLGYVADWTHPKTPNRAKSPRLIIPITPHTYIARDTRPKTELSEAAQGRAKQKARAVDALVCWIFNAERLQTATSPIFVVEGEIDAISIEQEGGAAVAIGSISNIGNFFALLDGQFTGGQPIKPTQPLIIALDNDAAGQAHVEKLADGLTARGIFFSRQPTEIWDGYKDANEALTESPATLKAAIADAPRLIAEEARRRAEDELERRLAAQIEYRKSRSAAAEIPQLFGLFPGLNNDGGAIPTGFSTLDRLLDGGLYEGLYIIGAISSLGKTTLVLQIADQIAAKGHDVLIFSLEMSRAELMAKSISRETVKAAEEIGAAYDRAKTLREITDRSRYQYYSAEERQSIAEGIARYRSYADHIFIREGLGNISAENIRQSVKEHIEGAGTKPVVIVDYLQIIAPIDPRDTDKRAVDKNVLELKRISRDYKIPVLGISSFNRLNYKVGVSETAFKESGAIEYGSDVLIGLQLAGMGEKPTDEEIRALKNAEPREIEAVILKNRNGGNIGHSALFYYYQRFNFFVDRFAQLEENERANLAERAKSPDRKTKKQRETDEKIKREKKEAAEILANYPDTELTQEEEEHAAGIGPDKINLFAVQTLGYRLVVKDLFKRAKAAAENSEGNGE